MAQAADNPNHIPEIQEPFPKIQKIHDNNGVSDTKPTAIAPFLLVKKLSEKAVLSFRASPLSAGYDLSSAVETKVPARGKAPVPTDLSVAVPEGTYARIVRRLQQTTKISFAADLQQTAKDVVLTADERKCKARRVRQRLSRHEQMSEL